jgi:hypothetical protein
MTNDEPPTPLWDAIPDVSGISAARPHSKPGELRRLIAESCLKAFIEERRITTPDLSQIAGHGSNAAMGTALRRGRGGKGGFNAVMDGSEVVRCQENAKKFVFAFDEGDDRDALFDRLDTTEEDFLVELRSWPKAPAHLLATDDEA